MDCKTCERVIIDYLLSNLSGEEAKAVEAHLAECESCRGEQLAYAALAETLGGEPITAPTAAESAALSRALDGVELAPVQRGSVKNELQGLSGLIAASVVAFLAIAAFLALQFAGIADLGAVAADIGYVPLAIAGVVIVFVTTFVPIAATARRRPLNGMTFRR